MAEKFSFEYVTTATGEINGESFITQTEDAINDLGVRVYNFNENVKETKVLSREVLEQVSRTERVANNAAEMATKASQDVNTMQETFTQWGSLIGETNSNSSQSLTIAKNAKEESANALVVATEAKSLAQTAKADAESASIDASKSATKAEASEKLVREAKALAEESRKFAESAQKNAETAGVKTVRYVAQELTDDEKAMARVNIDAAQGDSEGVFVPTSEDADDSGVDGKLRFYTPDNVLQVHTGNEWKSLFQYSGALDLVTLGKKQTIREEKTFSKGIVTTGIWGGSTSEGGVESGNLYLNVPRGKNATYEHKVYLGGTDEGAEAVRKDMLVGYATKTEVANTYLTKSAATNTYATKAELKEVSDNAGSGGDVDLSGYVSKEDLTTKLSPYAKTSDLDKVLIDYVTRSNLTATLQPYAKARDVNEVRDDLNSKANSSDLNNYVRKEGDRGVLKGYSRQEHRVQNGGTLTIDINSPDDLSVNIKGDVTVKFTKPEEGRIGTKVIHFWTTGTATIKWQNCTWSGGNAPTYGNPSKVLIVVARFSGDWTYTSAFVNTQG
ncbi:MAG: hypothetical protein KHY22_03995 [Sutterella wadsworthensis]|nr:hypothetical protein [Sutterella wadsworthensis]